MPAATEAFDPRFIRSLLHPIAHNLCGLFGFQTAQPKEDAKGADGGWVRSNLDNQVDHLTMLLKWRMDRMGTPNTMQALEQAVGELHAKMLATIALGEACKPAALHGRRAGGDQRRKERRTQVRRWRAPQAPYERRVVRRR